MTAPIADRLSRAKLLDRITEAMRAEQAESQRDKSWFNRGIVQGMGKALNLIGSMVAEVDPEPTDQQVLHAVQGILWPPHDPGQSWSPDTLDAIADVLTQAGYGRPNYLDDKETD